LSLHSKRQLRECFNPKYYSFKNIIGIQTVVVSFIDVAGVHLKEVFVLTGHILVDLPIRDVGIL